MTTKSALRILVALDNSPASLAAAEAGAQLAAALGAEISGLFVEDDRLLGLGHLAITREFDPLTATTRDVVREDLERQLRALAARARKFLARLAEGAGAAWSFRVARGSVRDEIRTHAAEADLVSLGRIGWSLASGPRLGSTVNSLLGERHHRRILVLTTATRMVPPVTVLHDGSASGREALTLAARLASVWQQPFHVLLVGDEPALRAEAAGTLGTQTRNARFGGLPDLPTERLAGATALRSTGPIVVPVERPPLDESFLRSLLGRVEQPVIAVHDGGGLEDERPRAAAGAGRRGNHGAP